MDKHVMPTILLALLCFGNFGQLYNELTEPEHTVEVIEEQELGLHDHPEPSMEMLWEQMFVLREWDGKSSIDDMVMARTVDTVLRKLPIHPKEGNTHALIMETARAESHMGKFNHSRRCVGGYGIFQIHKSSAEYVLKKTDTQFRKAVMSFYDNGRTLQQNLENNVRFSIAMCALYYHENGLEKRNIATMQKRGEFWKERYNTYKGAGTVDAYVKRNMCS